MSVSLRDAVARDHCLAPGRVDAPVYGGRYRSLFDDLPPLEAHERAAATSRATTRGSRSSATRATTRICS